MNSFLRILLQKEVKKWEIEELLTNFCSLSLEGVPLTVAIQQEKLHDLGNVRNSVMEILLTHQDVTPSLGVDYYF